MGKGGAEFGLDLKILTLDLRRIIRSKVDSWEGCQGAEAALVSKGGNSPTLTHLKDPSPEGWWQREGGVVENRKGGRARGFTRWQINTTFYHTLPSRGHRLRALCWW